MHARRSGDEYTYKKLAHIPHAVVGEVVNIWASVLECSGVRPTKGSDLMCNLILVDPSLDFGEAQVVPPELERVRHGVEVIMFAHDSSLFPKVRQPGDLIRFHRMEVSRYGNKPQLIAKVGGPPRTCHYCLFARDQDGSEDPYQRSSMSYTMRHAELEHLRSLRNFYAFKSVLLQAPEDMYLRTIREMRIESYVDLICRVLAVEGTNTRNPTMYVWDGTDSYPYGMQVDTRPAQGVTEGEQVPDSEWKALSRRLPALKGEGVVSDFPELGSALPVTVVHPITKADVPTRFRGVHEQSGDLPLPELPKPGAVVKLRNVATVGVRGQVQALFTRTSKWVAVTQWPQAAIDEYNARLQRNDVAGWAPQDLRDLKAVWTSASRDAVPYTSLRRVIMEADSGRSQSYKCLVRVLKHLPEDSRQFCRRRTPESAMEFCIKMLLQDATAELDAMLLGEHGSAFFRDCPQEDMSKNRDFAISLQECMLFIQEQEGPREGGSWLECCIQRAYPDKKGPRNMQTAKYRVVDTVITY